MALSILHNISAMTAQNQLSITQSNLQKTLTQLSSGSKITSGADDAAGLSIANGMAANIAALTQSGQNSTNAIGLLQTADGALSQVTSLLNRAVTLATEASSQGLSTTQVSALNTEFTSILSSINNIGTKTNFNGSAVFTASAMTPYLTDGTTGNDMLGGATMSVGTLTTGGLNIGTSATNSFSLTANPTANDTVTVGGTTYKFVATVANANEVAIGASSAQTLQNLAAAVNGGAGAGSAYGVGTVANTKAQATAVTNTGVTFTATTAGVGAGAGATGTGNNTVSTSSLTGAIGGWSNAATFSGGSGTADLTSTANAKVALVAITNAINQVAQLRGTLGANINQLTAASNVMNTQVQNLTSAESGITDADVASTVASMTKYNVLQSTGMAALQQANQASQSVLKLLQ